MKRTLILLACTFAASCASDPTEIILVIDSNLGVEFLPRVDIRVLGPSMRADVDTMVDFNLENSPTSYPLTIGLVRDSSAPGSSLQVSLTGHGATGRTIEASARTEFVPGESRALLLRLDAVCFDVSCEENSTCVEGVCVDDIVYGEDLETPSEVL